MRIERFDVKLERPLTEEGGQHEQLQYLAGEEIKVFFN